MSNFDVSKKVGQLRTIRQLMKQMKEKHELELADYLHIEQRLMGQLFQFLEETNQQNAKTLNGTVYKIQRVTYPLEDVKEFRSHVIGMEEWDLLDWRANKTACDKFRLDHGGEMKDGLLIGGLLPPGTRKNEVMTLGVKAPTKPKTTITTGNAEPVAEEATVETL